MFPKTKHTNEKNKKMHSIVFTKLYNAWEFTK